MMKTRELRIILSLLIIGFSPIVYAQDLDEGAGEVEDAEIVIVKERLIELPRATKIFERIKNVEPLSKPGIRHHEVKSFEYTPETSIPEFKAVTPSKLESVEEYKHYLKVGYGNFSSPLIKASFSFLGDERKMAGIDLNHESFGSGAKDGENSASSYSSARVFGSIAGKRTNYSAGINYGVSRDYFYGYSSSQEVMRDSIEHSYNYLDANFGINDIDSNEAFDYKVDMRMRSTSDNFNASENYFTISSLFGINQQLFLDTKFDYSNYTDAETLNRNHFRLKGYYRVNALTKLQVDGGLVISMQNDDIKGIPGSKVFPYMAAKYALFNNWDLIAGVEGGYDFNSYSELVNQNRYLDQAITVQNSEIKINGYAGIKGSPSQNVRVDLKSTFRSVENFMMLNNLSSADSSKFTTLYDQGSASIFGINGSVLVNLDQHNNIVFSADLTNYSLSIFDDPLHLPTTSLSISGEHTLMNRVGVGWNFRFMSGLKAMSPTGTEIVDLSSISELNLNLDYQFSDRAGAFLNVNNIFNQEYERYLNYPVRGVNLKFGFSYRF